jgi:hypothetical protein
MKYKLSTQLTNVDGTVIKDPGKSEPITFKAIAVACLVQAQEATPEDKYAAFSLAVRIEAAKEVVELAAEDVARLKRIVGANMPTVIVGRMFDLLDQK